MSRLGLVVRLVGAVVLLAIAGLAAVWLGYRASTSSQLVDSGIRSSLALVSNRPVEATSGNIGILNVSPEPRVAGRLSLLIDGGGFVADGASPPDQTIAVGQDGFSVVMGGVLGDSIGACDKGDHVRVVTKRSFSSLTETERNAIVQNIADQQKDRVVVYGDPRRRSSATPVEIAADMRFTVLRFTALNPASWWMQTRESSNSTSTSSGDSQSATGYEGFAQCSYRQGLLMTSQPWGRRFEFPPVTVSSVASDANAQAEAIRNVYRDKATPDYSYMGGTSFDRSETLEDYAGSAGSKDTIDKWGTDGSSSVLASVDQATMRFQDIDYGQWRDLQLFAAGALFSVCASMAIAILKTLARRSRLVVPENGR